MALVRKRVARVHRYICAFASLLDVYVGYAYTITPRSIRLSGKRAAVLVIGGTDKAADVGHCIFQT